MKFDNGKCFEETFRVCLALMGEPPLLGTFLSECISYCSLQFLYILLLSLFGPLKYDGRAIKLLQIWRRNSHSIHILARWQPPVKIAVGIPGTFIYMDSNLASADRPTMIAVRKPQVGEVVKMAVMLRFFRIIV